MGDTTPNGVIVIQGSGISIGQACSSETAHIHTTGSATIVRAVWRRCVGVRGRVRLRATLDARCALLQGHLAVMKAHLRRSFTAHRSRCGDGVIDLGGGEQCDQGMGCSDGQLCAACLCQPAPSTTTTIPPPVSFSGEVQPIFTQHCALPLCHGQGPIPPKLNLDLDPGSSYVHLFNVTSNECQEYALVVPGEPGFSYLVFKMENFPHPTTCRDGVQMPPGPPDMYPALGTSDVATITTWILQGAQNN